MFWFLLLSEKHFFFHLLFCLRFYLGVRSRPYKSSKVVTSKFVSVLEILGCKVHIYVKRTH